MHNYTPLVIIMKDKNMKLTGKLALALTNEKRGGLTMVLFDRSPFKLFMQNFQTNLFSPHPVRGLQLLSESCFYCLKAIVDSQ